MFSPAFVIRVCRRESGWGSVHPVHVLSGQVLSGYGGTSGLGPVGGGVHSVQVLSGEVEGWLP